jgi:hypothetical protein
MEQQHVGPFHQGKATVVAQIVAAAKKNNPQGTKANTYS